MLITSQTQSDYFNLWLFDPLAIVYREFDETKCDLSERERERERAHNHFKLNVMLRTHGILNSTVLRTQNPRISKSLLNKGYFISLYVGLHNLYATRNLGENKMRLLLVLYDLSRKHLIFASIHTLLLILEFAFGHLIYIRRWYHKFGHPSFPFTQHTYIIFTLKPSMFSSLNCRSLFSNE